jgi:hypothetical protein
MALLAKFTLMNEVHSCTKYLGASNYIYEKSRTLFIADFINGIKSPWFSYFIKFNPADYLSKTNCALLALNGEKDIQVDAK